MNISVNVGSLRSNDKPTAICEIPMAKCPQIKRNLLLNTFAVQMDMPDAIRLMNPIMSVPNLGLKPPPPFDNIVLEYSRIALIPVNS